MTIRLLAFAQLRDRLGGGALSVALPDGSTGREVAAWLSRRCPALEPLVLVSRLALNRSYVDWDVSLRDGDEVVVIPPVSGG